MTIAIPRKFSRSIKERSLTGAAIVALMSGSVYVQSAQPESNNSSQSKEAGAEMILEEIVVTALKREQRLIDVPASVTAIDASVFTSQDARTVSDYLRAVPGTSVGELSAGRTQVVLRGISTGFANNPTTGFTIDDVPINSSTSEGGGDVIVPNLDPADLKRVEVLRGPQGTLYGATSMGGLVKYVTVDPQADEFTGRLQIDGSDVEGGNQGYGVRGSANVPLVADQLGVRVNGFYRQDPGYVDNAVDGQSDVNQGEAYGGRIAAFWQITPDISFKLSALLQNRDADGSPNVDVDLTATPVFGDLNQQTVPNTGQFDSEVRLYSGVLSVDLGGITLTSLTGYSQLHADFIQDVTGSFGPFTPFFYGQTTGVRLGTGLETDKFSQEVRLQSSENRRLEWLAGLFYTDEKSSSTGDFLPVDPGTGALLPLPAVFNADSQSTFEEGAVFANLTFHITDQFDITVGGRYTSNEQKTDSVQTGFLVPGGFATTSSKSDDDATTFMVSVRQRWNDELMTYASVSSGYRPGGSNANAPVGVPQTFDPDSTTNYELGLKGSALDRRLIFEAAAFYIDWSDLQIRQVDPLTAFSFFGNSGSASSQGAELSLQAIPATGLNLGVNVAYTDAQLDDDAPPGTFAPAGTRLPNSSKWTANVSAEQEFPLTSDLDGFGAIQASYTGERLAAFQTNSTSPRFEIPDYVLVNLQLGVRTNIWTANVFVRNLTDKRGYLNANPYNVSIGGNRYLGTVVQPRTIGFSLATDF